MGLLSWKITTLIYNFSLDINRGVSTIAACGGLFTLMGYSPFVTLRPVSKWVRELGLASCGYTTGQLMRKLGMPNA